jgi:WD40 repeat protein
MAVKISRHEQYRAQIKTLKTFLAVSDKPEDDFARQEERQVERSCRWLEEREEFQEWRDVKEDTTRSAAENLTQYYWLSANPGTGKSVLAAHAISHLRTTFGLDCCFYFLQYGNKTRQTLSGMLRSIALQMALLGSGVRDTLLSLQEDNICFDKDDERAVWQKLFIGGIFQTKLYRPQYWVIDALDECTNYAQLFPLLTKIESYFPLRIFFTSRVHSDIQHHFSRLGSRVIEAHISEKDILSDVELYLKSRMDILPVESKAEREELIGEILGKSQGCFLWVKLVLQELGNVFCDKNIRLVIDDIPGKMGPFYERTVKLISQNVNVREKELTKAILVWTVCSTRPLHIEELQEAIELDIGSKVRNMKKSIQGLCGQLISVDGNNTVHTVHQTARDFLLKDKTTEFAIDSALSHERLATACLKYLSSREMRWPRNKRLLTRDRKVSRSCFADYACRSFSEHVFAASSEADDLLRMLEKFLGTNVLSWVEHVAFSGSLYFITRTAKNLKAYLDRRVKNQAPLGSTFQNVSVWTTDLIRLVAKFGVGLVDTPSSVYFLIPPLCPINSAIYKGFGQMADGLSFTGITNVDWEDCISCIEYKNGRAMDLSSGQNTFAIGMSSGMVYLYNQLSFQEVLVVNHGEPTRLIELDKLGKYLLTSGTTILSLWDLTGSMMWTTTMSSPCLALCFSEDRIYGITTTNEVVLWNMADGSVDNRHRYQYQEEEDRHFLVEERAPLAAAFSPDMALMALLYRGAPTAIWSLETWSFVGYCYENAAERDAGGSGAFSPLSALFHPNPGVELMVIIYQDGGLALYDSWSQQRLKLVEADASHLASAPNGRTLATGDFHGTLKIWDFEILALLYRIDCHEFDIKALVFSGDGARIVDIRDLRSKVWEPEVLIRKTIEEDHFSLSNDFNAPATTIDSKDVDKIVNITAMAPHPSECLIIVGKRNGIVSAYSTTTGKEVSTLYSHGKGLLIDHIICGDHVIASADSERIVKLWSLVDDGAGKFVAKKRLLKVQTSSYVRQLLLSPDGQSLLISTIQADYFVSTTTGELVNTRKSRRTGPWRWVCESDPNATRLLLVTEWDLQIYDWRKFSQVPLRNFLLEDALNNDARNIVIKSASEDSMGRYLVLDLQTSVRSNLLILNTPTFDELEDTVHIDSTFNQVIKRVQFFVGVQGTKIFFIDLESWFCSLDAKTFTGQEYARHFFVPSDLLGGNLGMLSAATSRGEVVFCKDGELAIVKNGLTFHNIVILSDGERKDLELRSRSC